MEDSRSASTSNAGEKNCPSKEITIKVESNESQSKASHLDIVNLKSKIKGVLKPSVGGKTITVKRIIYKVPGNAQNTTQKKILAVLKKPSQLQQQPIKTAANEKAVEAAAKPVKEEPEQTRSLNVISNTVVNFSKDEIRKFVSRVSDSSDKEKKPASVIIERRGRCKGSIAVIEGSENIRFKPKAVIKQYPGRVPISKDPEGEKCGSISKEQEKRIAEEQLRELEEEAAQEKERASLQKGEIVVKAKRQYKKRGKKGSPVKTKGKRGRPSKKLTNQGSPRRSGRIPNKVIAIASSSEDNSDIEYNSESEEEVPKKRNKSNKMDPKESKPNNHSEDEFQDKTEEKAESKSPPAKRSSDDKADGEPLAKKGRGRPRKSDAPPKKAVEKEVVASPSTRPQRTRKQVNYLEMLNPRAEEEPVVETKRRNSVNSSSETESPKKKRGRKKKVVDNDEANAEIDSKIENSENNDDNDLKKKPEDGKQRIAQSETDAEKNKDKPAEKQTEKKISDDSKAKSEPTKENDKEKDKETNTEKGKEIDLKESSGKSEEISDSKTEQKEDKAEKKSNEKPIEDSNETNAKKSDLKVQENSETKIELEKKLENAVSANGSKSEDKSVAEVKNEEVAVTEKVKEVAEIVKENNSSNADVKDESDSAVKNEGNQ